MGLNPGAIAVAPNGHIFVLDLFSGADGAPVPLRNNDVEDIMSACANTQDCTPHIDRGSPNSNISVNPLLVDAAGSNVRLLAGPPAIDRGASNAPELPATDVEDGPRTIGAAPDRSR